MVNDDVTSWLSIPGFCLSVISMICDVYVMMASIRLQSNLPRYSNDFVIFNLIFWLVIIDYGFEFFFCSNFIPYIFDFSRYSSALCTTIGAFTDFFGILGILWHILIAVEFLYLLFQFGHSDDDGNGFSFRNHQYNYNYDSNSIGKISVSSNNHLFLQNPKIYRITRLSLIGISIILALLPLFINGNHYIMFDNFYDAQGNGYGNECWLKDSWELAYYILLLISQLFHLCALIVACIKYKQTHLFTNAYLYLIQRLSPWIIVYTLIRVIPTVVRFWTVHASVKTIPLWLMVLHHCCLGSLGIANAVVWKWNRRVKINPDDFGGGGGGSSKRAYGGNENIKKINHNNNNNNNNNKKNGMLEEKLLLMTSMSHWHGNEFDVKDNDSTHVTMSPPHSTITPAMSVLTKV